MRPQAQREIANILIYETRLAIEKNRYLHPNTKAKLKKLSDDELHVILLEDTSVDLDTLFDDTVSDVILYLSFNHFMEKQKCLKTRR